MPPDLTAILNYKNEQVVAHFCQFHPEYSIQEGNELFTDLLAWMWLNRKRLSMGKSTYLFGPLLIIDQLWHSFILHTRDYHTFSNHYFGDYFHHEVEAVGFEHLISEEELSDFLQDCFEHLGRGWVERRFSGALE